MVMSDLLRDLSDLPNHFLDFVNLHPLQMEMIEGSLFWLFEVIWLDNKDLVVVFVVGQGRLETYFLLDFFTLVQVVAKALTEVRF